MKKTVSIILSIIMLLTAFPAMTAYAVSVNDFELSLKSDGTYEVTGYSGNNAGLNIPEAYNGIPVTSIGVSAFNGYTTEYYNQVITPKSLKSIGEAAFYFADSLNNVVLNEGLESIGDNAFDSCKLLTNINLPSTLKTLGNDVFANDVMLSRITVTQGNEYFSSDGTVLYNADKTKLVKYPSAASGNSYTAPYTVSEISDSAFTQMRYLKELTIPLSVTKIGEKAFSNDNAEYNYSLTDIYFLGTEEEWNKVSVGSGNTALDSVTVHYTPCEEHSWQDVEIIKEASCKEAGEKSVVCTVCGKTENQEIPISEGHSWDEGTVTTPPTCTDEGVKTYTCTVCEKKKTEPVSALGHNFKANEEYCLNGCKTVNPDYVKPSPDDGSDDGKDESKKEDSKADEKPSESAVKKITVKKPKLKKVKRVKGKKRIVKAFWSKVKGISGFEIQFSTSKKFKKSKTKTYRIKKSKTKKAFKKLKKKKKYYVRIRAYKTVKGKKYYSKWSNIKAVKTK